MQKFTQILVTALTLVIGSSAMATTPITTKTGNSGSGPQMTAMFAGGCFWCMQSEFDVLNGILSTTVGYTGGTKLDPTYEEVSSGTTGHAEAIQIAYDPSKVNYEQLLDIFWSNIDPTQLGGQFADHGSQYRTAVFYHSDEQRRLAEASRERLQRSGKFERPLVTENTPASAFYPAEEYHQRYYEKTGQAACGIGGRALGH